MTTWAEQGELFDQILAPAAVAIVATADLAGTVLDVGCGTGALLEATVDAGAKAVGVDISPEMLRVAERRVPQAITVLGDGQTTDLSQYVGAGFDRLVSRFGVMFFADPTTAFANLRRFAAPSATMTFVCWRDDQPNLMFTLGTRILAPNPPPSGVPGPMAFADADLLRGYLSDAGWHDIVIDRFEFVSTYGTPDGHGTTTDGIEERLSVIGATGNTDVDDETLARMRADIATSMVDGVVAHPNYCWLVTARA
ncbi:class I SAM-dependent methyltransferase [Gordonia sp. (in: high G+C Gram-positive bacteria)]|uniref:class I SAM-dependent methyltransferase n=1 Tax=Gordonia sp. (in: high G+C Gram-positive bacteria) TaxID=84139 RepID=UPI003C768B13